MTENTGWKQGGQWPPGESGNPDGRPRGSRNKVTLAVEALLDGESEAIARKAIELARALYVQIVAGSSSKPAGRPPQPI